MHSHQTDYSRYFALKQKVSLINVSEGRDREHFESLSGFVMACHGDIVELHIPYPIEQEAPNNSANKISFKLTSESMGNGIQVMTELLKVTAGDIFHLQLRGNLELFQRRKTPRIDAGMRVLHLRRDLSLTFFRKEWKRIVEYMKMKGLPANLVLHETTVNLSMGGIRLVTEGNAPQSTLSMFFIDIEDGQPPVCALAEHVWHNLENNELICGYRFIQILKGDQERINRYVQATQKRLGLTVLAGKTNWELVDQMTFSVL
jgi:hypothetical protein